MVKTDAIAAVLKGAADSGDVPGVAAAAATRDGAASASAISPRARQ